jgi:putative ABC transport system permease protein
LRPATWTTAPCCACWARASAHRLSYTLEFALVGLAASLLGVAIGFGVHHVFVVLLAGLVDSACPRPACGRPLFGLGMGLTLLVAFGLPPVLQLAQVPPLRVIRRDVGGLKPASLAVLGLGVAGFAALLLAVSSDLKLGLIAVGGFAGAVALFAALSWLAVKLLRASVNEATAPRWLVLATRQIAARPGLCRGAGQRAGRGAAGAGAAGAAAHRPGRQLAPATPPDAPNRFVINVMPEQADAFQKALREAGVRKYDWYPMIRGRLVAVNGRAVTPDDFTEDRAKRLVDREFNLSQRGQPPRAQRGGRRALDRREAGAVSVEEGIAKTLNLKLGDSAALRHRRRAHRRPHHQPAQGGLGLDARQFLRDVPGGQPGGCARHLHGLVPRARGPGFDNRLVRAFPNITSVDMSSTINQVQRVLDQVIRAVEFLFGFTLLAGLVVLFAAVTATREERAREFAIMRAVGARASLLRQVQRASWPASACWPAFWPARWPWGWAGRWRTTCLSSSGPPRRWVPCWARWPARCWRWRPAGGACARCCAARWWRRCGVRPSSDRKVPGDQRPECS